MIYTNPHIVLEGPDGAGKTTLARELVASFKYRYHHEGPPKKNNMLAEYASIFLQVVGDLDDSPVVFDRLHIGETIYGPLLRGRDRVGGIQGVRLLNRLFRANGAVPILVCPPFDVVKKNWENNIKNELVKNFTKIVKIYSGYMAYHGDHFVADYTFPPSMEYFWKVVHTKTVRLGGDFIGAPFSRIVFVGDMPNQELDLPFFSLSGSSAFFWNCLEQAGYTENEILVTNAKDPKGNLRDPETWLTALPPGPKTIVALGGNAERAILRNYPLPFEALLCVVNHPQHVKRFFHSRTPEYIHALKVIKGLAFVEGVHRAIIR